MTAALAGGIVCALVAAVAGVVASHRRRRSDRALASWTEPDARRLPAEVDLDLLDLAPPAPGRVLAVLFTHPDCGGCAPVQRRVEAIEGADLAVVDVSKLPRRVRACGVESVPTLVLVGSDGAVRRSWIGTPLAGTIEETVRSESAR